MKSVSVYHFLTAAAVAVAVLGAGCAAQSVTGSIQQSVMRSQVQTRIPLAPGDSIGVNMFPDGDTATGGQGQKIDNLLECHQHMSELFHIHVHLSIFDTSATQIMVPWGLGIVQPYTFNKKGNQIVGGTCFYNLHTHDRSGVIHDESKTDLGLTLGNVFDVWGMPLSTTNVAGYTGTVWVKVITPQQTLPWSSTIDPRTILLTDKMQITLSVGQKISPVPIYNLSKF
jgi:hypothetical protein